MSRYRWTRSCTAVVNQAVRRVLDRVIELQRGPRDERYKAAREALDLLNRAYDKALEADK